MCFFRLHIEHPYQDVVAIFEMAGIRDAPGGDPGLHHMQLRNASLADLGRALPAPARRRASCPIASMDHGPSTSLYYRDPDQNAVEIAASNFATARSFRLAWRPMPSGATRPARPSTRDRC